MKQTLYYTALILSTLYLCVLFVFPMSYLFYEFILYKSYLNLFDTHTLSIVYFTLRQAMLSTVFSAIIGIFLSWFLFRHTLNSYTLKIYEWLLMIPFILPTLLISVSIIATFGEKSLIKSTLYYFGFSPLLLYSESSVIFVHALINAPWIALQLLYAQKSIPKIEIDAIQTLTGSRFKIFNTIYLPRLKWPLYTSCIQVFQLSAFSFIIVLLIGGGPPVQTIETALYGLLRQNAFETTALLPLAFYGFIISFTPWVILFLLESKSRSNKTTLAYYSERPLPNYYKTKGVKKYAFSALGVFFVFIFLVPYFSLLSPFFSHSINFSIADFIFTKETMNSLLASVKISSLQTMITLTSCICLLYVYRHSHKNFQKIIFTIAQLPSGFSTLIIGFNFLLFFSGIINFFENNILAIVFLQSIVFYPFAFRLLWPVTKLEQKNLSQAALLLGATPLKAFITIEWFRFRKPLLISAITLFCLSLGDITSVLLFYSDDFIPLTVLISRLIGQYRFEEAQVLSTFLFLFILVSLFFAFKLEFKKENL